jgi:hypothetical protein
MNQHKFLNFLFGTPENISVLSVTFWVWEVLGSNFGPNIKILTKIFNAFPHCFQANASIVPQIRP